MDEKGCVTICHLVTLGEKRWNGESFLPSSSVVTGRDSELLLHPITVQAETLNT
jgi:hypothetical protein